MTWPESVDEALDYGWIEGVRRRIALVSYRIRFTPRRPGSIWSRVNLAKAEALIAQQRMQPAGLAAYAARTAEKSGVYAFERAQPAALAADELRAFKREATAWRYFESTPPGSRNVVLHRVVSATRRETRARRLAHLIEACVGQRRVRSAVIAGAGPSCASHGRTGVSPGGMVWATRTRWPHTGRHHSPW